MAGLPIARISVNGAHVFGGSEISEDIEHDVSMGTLTVTFVNVRALEVVYKHMEPVCTCGPEEFANNHWWHFPDCPRAPLDKVVNGL